MLLTALITIIILILLVLVGVLNPNTGETTLGSRYAQMEAQQALKLADILWEAEMFSVATGTNNELSRESMLAVYLLGEGDEVFDHLLTVAIEERNAKEIARLLGVPTQSESLEAHLYG